MANKRMFSNDIVGSDSFLEMPSTSQALYFHLGMRSDDDGFVNPNVTMRMTGANKNDLDVLILKNFLIPFQNGVLVIKHHRMNNNWNSRDCKRTVYTDEFSKLYIKENRAYTLDKNQGIMLDKGYRNTLPSPTQGKPKGIPMVEENRIEENRIEEGTPTKIEFIQFWGRYPKKVERKKSEEKWNKFSVETQHSILKDIPLRKNGKQWKAGYIPNPTTYFNGERWNDEIEQEIIKETSIKLN